MTHADNTSTVSNPPRGRIWQPSTGLIIFFFSDYNYNLKVFFIFDMRRHHDITAAATPPIYMAADEHGSRPSVRLKSNFHTERAGRESLVRQKPSSTHSPPHRWLFILFIETIELLWLEMFIEKARSLVIFWYLALHKSASLFIVDCVRFCCIICSTLGCIIILIQSW